MFLSSRLEQLPARRPLPSCASPLARACAIVPALALADVLPLTPGNMGVSSAAIAVSLHLNGVGLGSGIATGIVIHVVETTAGLAFGTCSAVILMAMQKCEQGPQRHRLRSDLPTLSAGAGAQAGRISVAPGSGQ